MRIPVNQSLEAITYPITEPSEENSLTPLQSAVIHNDTELVRMLIEEKADPDLAFDPSKIPLINNSRIFYHLEWVSKWKLFKSTSPLSIAVWHKNTTLVKLLLSAKANPNLESVGASEASGEPDQNKLSPLHIAAANKDHPMVNLLIQAGANIYQRAIFDDDRNNSVLWFSVAAGDIETVNTLLNLINRAPLYPNYQDDINRSFNRAVSIYRMDLVQRLLQVEPKPDVNYQSASTHMTPVLRARTCPEILKLLIDLKADCKVVEFYGGYSLLHMDNQPPEIVRLLIEKGLDVNLKDKNNSTPINYIRNPESIKLLLNAKADPNIPDIHGYTPLHSPQTKKSIELLVNAKADPTAKDLDGDTPLIRSASFGFYNQVKTLLEIKTVSLKINHENKKGETALFRAAINNKRKIFNLLLKHGARFGQSHKDFNLDSIQKLMADYPNVERFNEVTLRIWSTDDKPDFSPLAGRKISWSTEILNLETLKKLNEIKLFNATQAECILLPAFDRKRINRIRLALLILSPNIKQNLEFPDSKLSELFFTLNTLDEKLINSSNKKFECIEKTHNLIKPALEIFGVNRGVNFIKLPDAITQKIFSILIGLNEKSIPQLIIVALALQRSASVYKQLQDKPSYNGSHYYLTRLVLFFQEYSTEALKQKPKAPKVQSSSDPNAQGKFRRRVG